MDDNVGTAGKAVPEEYARWVEADAAEAVRSEDVVDGDCVCLGKGVYAVESCDG